MKRSRGALGALALLMSCGAGLLAAGGDRDKKVRQDRKERARDGYWIYDDLEAGFTRARETGKPMLVVLRCIP